MQLYARQCNTSHCLNCVLKNHPTSSPNCLCTSITGKISMAPTPLLAKGNGTLARKWRKIKKRCSSFSSGDSLSRSKSEDRSSHCAGNGLSNFSSHSHKVSDVECSTDDLRTHSRDHSVSILLDFVSTITITNEASKCKCKYSSNSQFQLTDNFV